MRRRQLDEEALELLADFELLDDAVHADTIRAELSEGAELPEVVAAEHEDIGVTTIPSAAPTEAKAKKTNRVRKAGVNSNRARNERRAELVYLRSKVQELEAQLKSIKSADADPEATGSSPFSSTSKSITVRRSTVHQEIGTCVWAELASRQYAERQQAELKNVQLKMLLEGQIKVATGLERLLNNRANAQVCRHFRIKDAMLIYIAYWSSARF